MSIVQKLKTQLPSSTRSRCVWHSVAMSAGRRLLLGLNQRLRLRLGHRHQLAAGLDLVKALSWTVTGIQPLNLTLVQSPLFDLRLAINYRFASDSLLPEQGIRPATPLVQYPGVLKAVSSSMAASPSMLLAPVAARSLPADDLPLNKGVEQIRQTACNSFTVPSNTSMSRSRGMTAFRLIYRNEPGAIQQSLPEAVAPSTSGQIPVPFHHPSDKKSAWPVSTSADIPSLVDSLFDSAMQRRPLPGFDLQPLPPKDETDRQVSAITAIAQPQPGPAKINPQQEQWTRNDLSQLADQIDRLLRQRQRLERERRGKS